MNEDNPPEAPEMPAPKASKRRLLPGAVTHPLTLLIAVVVPQLILLVLNLRSYHLMSGEVNESQQQLAAGLFAGELVILVGGFAVTFWLWRQSDKFVPWVWNLVIFIPPTVYLTFFTMKFHEVVPGSLQLWIVEPQRLIFYQFVFLMPAIFLAALGLACFPMRGSRGKDVGISLGLAVGIPVFWYVAIQVGSGVWLGRLPGTLIFIMVVGMGLVCLTGVLRLLTLLFTWALGKGRLGQSILIALVSIVAPIGGLLLNRKMPFPGDFQIWPVYVMTILNGVLLTMPKLDRPGLDRIVWLLQCALFPFTAYFFLVFLPYLPLAAIAIIAAGAGFLILSPTALFIIHLLKLHQALPDRKFWVYGILAAMFLPAYAQVEMMIDRRVLHRAIDYVYSPDLESSGQFKGSRAALRRSLERMQNIKHGVDLPFLVEWYNHSVLDGLVLSDQKMIHLYATFFGETMPEPKELDFLTSELRGNRGFMGRQMTPPPSDAVLNMVTHSSSSDPKHGTRTVVKLELHNPTSQQTEFVTTIDLPSGVFVSNYWLHIGDERVPGRIFEKKTAMWIYRMIRDASRRDPGLLTYLGPNQLSLRVFPFAPKEARITEIEFLSPPGISPELRIGEKIIPGGETDDTGIVLAKPAEDRQSIFVSEGAMANLPATVREPYLHFVVDRSLTGLDAQGAVDSMIEAASKFPEIEDFTLSLANYEFVDSDLNSKPQALEQLDDDATKGLVESLPLRGGFLAEQAMQRILSAFRRQQMESESAEDLLRFPVLVLVTGDETPECHPKELKWYQSVTPDAAGYFTKVDGTDSLISKGFGGERAGEFAQAQQVLIFSNGKQNAVVGAGKKSATASFASGESIEVYDSDSGKFRPISESLDLPAESAWSKAADLQNWESRIRWNPATTDALLATAVEKSRETGFLTPSTAYIVVENSAQWKMLKKKEKEKLKANQSLDFMEAPEPHLWLVALLFGLLLLVKRRIVRRRNLDVATRASQ